jgi:hypothetical protein
MDDYDDVDWESDDGDGVQRIEVDDVDLEQEAANARFQTLVDQEYIRQREIRRPIRERNNACSGQEDMITRNIIQNNNGIFLDNQCYDLDSLAQWMTYLENQGQPMTLPHNRRVITWDEYNANQFNGGYRKKTIRNNFKKGRKGKSRKGKSRKGKSRKGKSRKGKSRKGKSRKGKSRKGKSRKGKSRKGKSRKE